jgi:hypothetical protein
MKKTIIIILIWPTDLIEKMFDFSDEVIMFRLGERENLLG